MENLVRILDNCNRRQKQVLPVLEKWVRQNSYSAEIENVNACGRLIAEDFKLNGLSLERHPGNEVGDHLVFKTDAWEKSDPSERVVFVGHHDTVFPPATFEVWNIEGDVLRGPGVLDMKGGIATIWAALASLADCDLLSKIPLAFACVGDEEIGSPDSTSLLKNLALGAKAALVFEAGRKEDAIITRRKGTGGMTITCHGVAAHAGNHHQKGKNAIWALARLIDKLQRITNYDKGITLNVGLVKGGEARNTVPPLAECQVDIRFITEADGQFVVEKIKETLKNSQSEGCRFELLGGIRRLPLEKTERSKNLYHAYARAAKAESLGCVEAELVGGGSDASTISSIGVPSIDGMGPRGSGFHTKKEYIEISSLLMRSRALLRFLLVEQNKLV